MDARKRAQSPPPTAMESMVLCAVSMGARCAAADECAGARAENRRVNKGAPAGGPDVEALIQIAAANLLRDGGEAFEGRGGNNEPERGKKRRQRKDGGHDAARVTDVREE